MFQSQPRLWMLSALFALGFTCSQNSLGQILEFKFNDTGTTSTSTGSSPTEVTFYDASMSEADLHSSAGLGVAGDIAGHPDFGTDTSFDNTASLGMQSVGGIALNLTDTSVSELDSWTLTGWYKTESEVFGGGGTVVFMSPPRWTSQETGPTEENPFYGTDGIDTVGFAVRGATANGFRTRVNNHNLALGDAAAWEDISTWVYFAISYDGTGFVGNVNYYRGYRNETEGGENPAETTQTAFGTLDEGTPLPAAGIAMGNRVDAFGRAFDGWLDNIRVFGSRSGGDGALTIEQVEAIRAYDMAIEHVPGDFNSDGTVDVGDYELWKMSFGSSDYLYPDGNDDGIVNLADYTVWRNNLGASSTPLGAIAAVPEPSTLALAGIVPVLLFFGRRFWRC